ncbi:MAG: PEGA domain-containing protein [Myxococcales bacterium]|nr:PEGA domain-containing protein [Myxococcales bacterium]
MSGAPNATVRVDGKEVGAAPYTGRLVVRAEPYVVEASAPGFSTAKQSVFLKEGESAAVTLGLSKEQRQGKLVLTTKPEGRSSSSTARSSGRPASRARSTRAPRRHRQEEWILHLQPRRRGAEGWRAPGHGRAERGQAAELRAVAHRHRGGHRRGHRRGRRALRAEGPGAVPWHALAFHRRAPVGLVLVLSPHILPLSSCLPPLWRVCTMSLRRAVTLGIISLAGLAWSGCEGKKQTEFVAGISTQVRVPKDLKTIRVDVLVGGTQVKCDSYRVYDGKVQLPRRSAALPISADNRGLPVTITVAGYSEERLESTAVDQFADCVNTRIELGTNAAKGRILRSTRQTYSPTRSSSCRCPSRSRASTRSTASPRRPARPGAAPPWTPTPRSSPSSRRPW